MTENPYAISLDELVQRVRVPEGRQTAAHADPGPVTDLDWSQGVAPFADGGGDADG